MAAAMEGASEQLLERIVKMRLMDIPKSQICEAVGMTDMELEDVLASEIYRAQFAVEAERRLRERDDTNRGWDYVEQKALAGLVDILAWNKDPDLMVKVAMVANRAQRRGADRLHLPIDARQNTRVTINLTQQFATAVQAGHAQLHGRQTLAREGEGAGTGRAAQPLNQFPASKPSLPNGVTANGANANGRREPLARQVVDFAPVATVEGMFEEAADERPPGGFLDSLAMDE